MSCYLYNFKYHCVSERCFAENADFNPSAFIFPLIPTHILEGVFNASALPLRWTIDYYEKVYFWGEVGAASSRQPFFQSPVSTWIWFYLGGQKGLTAWILSSGLLRWLISWSDDTLPECVTDRLTTFIFNKYLHSIQTKPHPPANSSPEPTASGGFL